MTKLCISADKQNNVSQSEDALHSKLNYIRMNLDTTSFHNRSLLVKKCKNKNVNNS